MRKHHILYIVIAIVFILELIFIENNNSNNYVFALSYESNIGIGFTFNPSLSLSISSPDLVIDNLTPGTTADSNDITISAVTNAAYGYTLSAITSNNNLVRSDNVDSIFSNIATDANLETLTTDNTWGYSTSLDNGNSWSNYNGLSSSSSTTLLDTNTNNILNNGIDSVSFKIAAKAGNTQPSGIYTGTINFMAVTKVAPMSLLDSFIASGAEQLNGYFKMQDMTHDICQNVDIEESELQLIDVRDNKIYWVAKLKDGNCWMTQNLDLDLDSNRTYTHWDTDLGWSENNINKNATWQPIHSTISFDSATTNQVQGWVDSNIKPYSANPGDIYYYTSNTEDNDIKYSSLQECITAGHNDCTHYHAGNYYNWSAAVGSNDTSETASGNAPDSVCTSGWRLPKTRSSNDFTGLVAIYEANTNDSLNLRLPPLYFNRTGIFTSHVTYAGRYSGYWSRIALDENRAQTLYFFDDSLNASININRYTGFSVRCLAR